MDTAGAGPEISAEQQADMSRATNIMAETLAEYYKVLVSLGVPPSLAETLTRELQIILMTSMFGIETTMAIK